MGRRTSHIERKRGYIPHSLMRAKIAQVFKSIQGEGRYAGCQQIFIRFFGCNLECKYCDTRLKKYKLYTPQQLRERISIYKTRFISLTGGEPLLHGDFINDFLAQVSLGSWRVYLETNATLYKQLARIIDRVDIISFDLKLASSTGGKSLWGRHEKFFKVAKKKEVFFKTVITSTTDFKDVERVAEFMKDKRAYTLYLQPDSKRFNRHLRDKIFYFQEYLLDKRVDARFLPQIHKFLKLR